MADQRTGRAWMALVSECKQTYPWICHLCGQAIPMGVHRNHELAYQADHVLAANTHPYLLVTVAGLRPSHRRCNRYRSDRDLTPALIAEVRARFAPAADRPALKFFSM